MNTEPAPHVALLREADLLWRRGEKRESIQVYDEALRCIGDHGVKKGLPGRMEVLLGKGFALLNFASSKEAIDEDEWDLPTAKSISKKVTSTLTEIQPSETFKDDLPNQL